MYPKLRSLYGTQVCILLALAISGCMAPVDTLRGGLPAKNVYMWLGVVALFVVPLMANAAALICLMFGRLFSSCVGFATSAMACLTAWNIPALKTAIDAMPLSWAYWPVILLTAVLFPFVLWLLLAGHILLGIGKRNPFDPF